MFFTMQKKMNFIQEKKLKKNFIVLNKDQKFLNQVKFEVFSKNLKNNDEERFESFFSKKNI